MEITEKTSVTLGKRGKSEGKKERFWYTMIRDKLNVIKTTATKQQCAITLELIAWLDKSRKVTSDLLYYPNLKEGKLNASQIEL